MLAWLRAAIDDVLNASRAVELPDVVEAPDQLIDLRAYARPTYKRKGEAHPRPYTPARRAWSKTTGVCLHQTACVLGERAERMYGVGAHFVVTRRGVVYWLHDFNREVIHGNGWNAQTWGIEIDGLYAGVEGDPSTVWDDPSTPRHEQGMVLTDEAVFSTMQLIRWGHHVVTSNGGDHRALVAHRQASDTRRNDPGSAIWQRIALPMQEELDLRDGGERDPQFHIGDGYPIPEAWNPVRRGIKY